MAPRARLAALVLALLGTSVALIPAPVPAPRPAAGALRTRSPAALAAALCDAASGRVTGTLADPALLEASGLAWSRSWPGLLWTHNDSGDGARVFALGRNGASLGTVDVAGATAVDWEDMAVGRGPGGSDHLFLADIGGGASGGRSTVTIYRIPEPAPPGAGATAASARADVLTLRYPDGAWDAEALLVDDRNGDLVVVTKVVDGPAAVYRAPGASTAAADGVIVLERVGELTRPPTGSGTRALLDLGGLAELADRVTGADASPAGGVAVVRTYASVAVHRWPGRRTLAEALLTEPCAAPAPTDLRFPQGEAIALSPDGRRYVTVAEGVGAPLVEVRART